MMKTHNHKPLPCIYKIQNLQNGRFYIGRSTDAWRRWEEHYTSLKYGKYSKEGEESAGKVLMQEDWNKYGKNNFGFICLIERSNRQLLEDLEVHLIKMMNPTYNTVHASKEEKQADKESVKFLIEEFLYSWIAPQLRELPLNEAYNFTRVWERLVQLRAVGLSNRKKSDFEAMIAEVHSDKFEIKNNFIRRIK